jgi:aspartate carbamoyltransferase catalytic subunit
MGLSGRDLVTMDDLSTGEMEAIFSLADEISESMGDQFGVCRGKVMASLFFEPSTRTRLSFEAAMHRLGGGVISVPEGSSSSMAKGESLADMARVVGSYADVLVVRHPWEGAARVVADYADVPVINGGDGGHQHPTQTLCDLYTLRKGRGTIRGLRIALWGDLKYGRTIHSLMLALAKFGADILFCPSPGLEVPDNVIRKLVAEYGGKVEYLPGNGSGVEAAQLPLDALYITPNSPHQLAMMPDVNLDVELKSGVDALYVTRPQKERFAASEQDKGLAGRYPVVDKKLLKGKRFERTMVMHPLPRVDELAYEVDADPRSTYFQQAAHGVPIRMALVALLLGAKDVTIASASPICPNPRCVSIQPSETRYLKPEFLIVSRDPVTLRCIYCEHGFRPEFVASSDWHEGRPEYKRYHRADSHWARRIKPENLIVFNSAEDAETEGFRPASQAAVQDDAGEASPA